MKLSKLSRVPEPQRHDREAVQLRVAQDLDLRVRGPRPQRAAGEVVLAAADLLAADRLLHGERQPGADRLHDGRRAALVPDRRIGVVGVPAGARERMVPPPGTEGTRLRSSERSATRTPGVPGPPMNLWGEMKTASLYASCPSGMSGAAFMSIGRYGPAAA